MYGSTFSRLIEQFERKSEAAAKKAALKPRIVIKEKTKPRDSSPEDSEGGAEVDEDESSSSLPRRPERHPVKDEKKAGQKKKPSFLLQTSSGRTPKATTRYVAEGGPDGHTHHSKRVARPADEQPVAAAKRAKLMTKIGGEGEPDTPLVAATAVPNKIGVTIRKSANSSESDTSFESSILGLEEELLKLPPPEKLSKKGTKKRQKKTRVAATTKRTKEDVEEMPPKLEPNYPDLKEATLQVFFVFTSYLQYRIGTFLSS